MNFHGKEYTEVKDRIVELLRRFPDAMIETQVIWNSADFTAVTIGATVYPDKAQEGYYFTGIAYEERGQGVNSDAWVENCETSAIGRALANMNIGVNGTRPSAEEMKKVQKKPAPDVAPPPHLSDQALDLYHNICDTTDPEQVKVIVEGMKKVEAITPGTYTPEEIEYVKAEGRKKYLSLTKKG